MELFRIVNEVITNKVWFLKHSQGNLHGSWDNSNWEIENMVEDIYFKLFLLLGWDFWYTPNSTSFVTYNRVVWAASCNTWGPLLISSIPNWVFVNEWDGFGPFGLLYLFCFSINSLIH